MTGTSVTVETERFWAKVDTRGECWLWTASDQGNGYGQFYLRSGKKVLAHRWSYEATNGPIPDGLRIDHLCRVRRCVRPSHLRTVSHRGAMKTHTDYALHILANIDHTPEGCWRWTGYIGRAGYGQVGRNLRVHRIVWEHLIGPLTPGMTLDHQCHNRDLTCNLSDACPHRRCVNPAHLEEVTPAVNGIRGRVNAAKTHCANGHEFTEANVYHRQDRTGRHCKLCKRESDRRSFRKRQEQLTWQRREWRHTGIWPSKDAWPERLAENVA